MSNLRIAARLALGFAVMAVFMAIITFFAVSSFSELHSKVTVILKDKWPKTVLLHQLKDQANEAARAIRNMIILSEPSEVKKELARIEKAREETKAALEELARATTSDRGKELLGSIQTNRSSYLDVQSQLLDMIAAGKKTEAGDALVTRLRPVQLAYLDAVNRMIRNQGEDIARTGADVDSTIKSVEAKIGAALLIAIVLAALIGFVITRSITVPLHQLMGLNQAIADGNLSIDFEVTRRDEIGKLSGSAKVMTQNLKSIITHLAATSSQIASASSQLFSTSEHLATASGQVASQTTTVATAGEEMAATSGDIARNCNVAVAVAEKASTVAAEGAVVVNNAVGVMDRIAQKVQLAAQTVDGLGSRSDQIGEIVGTIEDIADQTNLLALNAAIEAARAGDQGRGFAVVADEVRALAERTTKATREIGEMIKGIQGETKAAVNTMEDGVNEVKAGTAEANRSGTALQEILVQIGNVSLQVSQIATAAEEQTATTTEISGSIQQMSEVVQETARSSHELSQAANGLSLLAEDLKGVVGRFKLA
jgi:methyl-accepting chemotaxis protein